MAINLTTPFTLTNGARLVFNGIRVDEDASTLDFTVNLRHAVAGTPPDTNIATKRLQIRATGGDQVQRGVPIAGGSHEDHLLFVANAVSVASAFVNAYAALKASRAAFEAHLLSAGYVHSSLTGT